MRHLTFISYHYKEIYFSYALFLLALCVHTIIHIRNLFATIQIKIEKNYLIKWKWKKSSDNFMFCLFEIYFISYFLKKYYANEWMNIWELVCVCMEYMLSWLIENKRVLLIEFTMWGN